MSILLVTYIVRRFRAKGAHNLQDCLTLVKDHVLLKGKQVAAMFFL